MLSMCQVLFMVANGVCLGIHLTSGVRSPYVGLLRI